MKRLSAFLAALLAMAAPAAAGEAQTARHPGTQYVLISFDGAHDNAQWRRAEALAEKTGGRFTFFLSCAFLLTPETKHLYVSPKEGRGASNVGFGKSADDVRERLSHILSAWRKGHEIASHGCGHFDGKDWSESDWRKEFASFAHFLSETWTINGFGDAPKDWSAMAQSVTGFRAPYLSVSDALFAAERDTGYSYDASTVSRAPQDAVLRSGLARISLPMIPEGTEGRPVIAMDYNWFVRHSAGFDNPSKAAEFEERAYRAMRNEFDRQYAGARLPVQAGFHFTLMNDGAYWRALERFAGEVCDLPDVACVPMRKYLATVRPLRGVILRTGG